jgi:hypothetical protein
MNQNLSEPRYSWTLTEAIEIARLHYEGVEILYCIMKYEQLFRLETVIDHSSQTQNNHFTLNFRCRLYWTLPRAFQYWYNNNESRNMTATFFRYIFRAAARSRVCNSYNIIFVEIIRCVDSQRLSYALKRIYERRQVDVRQRTTVSFRITQCTGRGWIGFYSRNSSPCWNSWARITNCHTYYKEVFWHRYRIEHRASSEICSLTKDVWNARTHSVNFYGKNP